MDAELAHDKKSLAEALGRVADRLNDAVSVYALVETEDPQFPFELLWIRKPTEASADGGLIVQRLYDNAFLPFGFREVRDEKNIEGVVFKGIDEMLSDPECVGVAPVGYFDVDRSRARMAAGADEDPEEDDADALRFVSYLKLIEGRVLAGQPQERLDYEHLVDVKGIVLKFDCGQGQQVVAFQRTQPMWISKKSSLLLFGRDGSSELFADRSLKVGTNFDFLHFDDKLYFQNMRALETLFAYRKLIARQAKDYADTFEPIVADFEKLDERIEASRAVANKVLKLQETQSPVAELSPEELEYRVQRIAYYSSKLKFNEEGKLMLVNNTDVSDFLRMLSDDLLVSPLSQALYETRSKKRLDAN